MCSSDFFCAGVGDFLCFFYYFCDEFGGVVIDCKALVDRTDNPVKRLIMLLLFDGKQCSFVFSGHLNRFGRVLVVAGRGGGANDRRREQEPYSTRRLHIIFQDMYVSSLSTLDFDEPSRRSRRSFVGLKPSFEASK